MAPPARRSAASAASGAARPRKPRLGSESPRIFTPPLRDLTPETSLGFACIEFAETVCEVELYPWQRWLLIHALELHPDLTTGTLHERGRLDPIFRFRKIVVLVARQNGKSTLSQVLSLFFLYELGTDLILGTAQDLDTAEEVWEGALDIIEETPELAERAAKPIMVNGKKTIRLLTGERYKVKAANRKAGRGLSGDLILLDELREHQSWDAWGAITKTTMARPAAQIWALSNAGDATSVVLSYLRRAAHEAVGDPDGIVAATDLSMLLPSDDDLAEMADLADGEGLPDLGFDDIEEDGSDLGLFEWSAPPDCSVHDRDGWTWANPSLGHGISERTLAADAKSDPEWVFRTECLCQWSEGTLEGPFPPGRWETGTDAESKIAPTSRLKFCVDVSVDRSKAYIAVAGERADGIPHIEVIAAKAGTAWLEKWFETRVEQYGGAMEVAIQKTGAPASSLIEELNEIEGVTVIEWGGADLGKGTGAFFDAVTLAGGMGVRHIPQPVLDVAAATAVTKYLGDGAVAWDRKHSPTDIASLVAVTGALWALGQRVEKSLVSAYETAGVMTI